MRRNAWHCTIGLAGALAIPIVLAANQPAADLQKFNGAWVLNRQQSTGAGAGGADPGPGGGGHRRGGFSGGFGGPGGMGRGIGGGSEDRAAMERQRALMHELLEPVPRITVTAEGDVLTFAAADGRVRRYRIDGKKEKHQFDNGTVDTKSRIENGQLIIETSSPGGAKLVESYSINDQHQLVIEAKLDGGHSGDHPGMVHVYDEASTLQ